jgi:hypothetical protein
MWHAWEEERCLQCLVGKPERKRTLGGMVVEEKMMLTWIVQELFGS